MILDIVSWKFVIWMGVAIVVAVVLGNLLVYAILKWLERH